MDNTTTTTTTTAQVQLWSCEYRLPCGWCKLRNQHCDHMVTPAPTYPTDPIYPDYPHYPPPTITWDPYTRPSYNDNQVYCNAKEDTK